MRSFGLTALLLVAAQIAIPQTIAAQDAQPGTRAAAIEQDQAAKVPTLKPYEPNAGERWAQKAQDILIGGGVSWHPFFESAYAGGGFTLGAGYMHYVGPFNSIDMHYVGPFNSIDMRGSYTLRGYKRAEVEFSAPRLFDRRGSLALLGGWREATEVGFYGIGTGTVKEDQTSYGFERPYASALLTVRPTRKFLMLRGGLEWTRWAQEPADGGAFPSVETVYTPETLPGLNATVNYVHTQGTVGFEYRTSPGYSRRGGFAGVTGHDFTDTDGDFGFRQVDYEVIQHIPILREAWAISLRALVSSTFEKDGQDIPFFMLPSLGGGSNLRGFSSWRFRDRHSMLLQGEWRIMVNRFLDTAVFYDTGKVGDHVSDLDFTQMKHDVGFGVRFHSPVATPLRVDIAKSREGLHFVFSSSAVF